MGSASGAVAVRCGIVLAAGEGERLKAFVYRLRGDALPKQYVNFIGTRSMLEHTFSRVQRLIPPTRLCTVVSRDHLVRPEVRRQLLGRPRGTVVVQPANKGTGPGILLPLMHLYKRHPEAVSAVFPSDHFILEEDLFNAHVDLAFRVVERYPSFMVLLGVKASEPEPEHGYIVPGKTADGLALLALQEVLGFVEKPNPMAAQELISRGGLWNTLIMVFKAKTLFDLVWRIAPELRSPFERIRGGIGSPRESEIVDEAYEDTRPVDFSRQVLEVISLWHPAHLLVLPVHGVHWCDWGSARRVLNAIRKVAPLERLGGRAARDAMLVGETDGTIRRMAG